MTVIRSAISPGDPLFEVVAGKIIEHTVVSLDDKNQEITTDKDILDYAQGGRSWFCFRFSAEQKVKEDCPT